MKAGTQKLPIILLWLFVVNLGIAMGAGLYEARIVVPDWLVTTDSGQHWSAETASADDTGRRFWGMVTTAPLTLITIANLIAAWKSRQPVRRWWVAAGLVALADRVFTLAYFVPTMIGLMNAPDSPASVATAAQWVNLNTLRHALVFAAWLLALKTFAVWYRGEEAVSESAVIRAAG